MSNLIIGSTAMQYLVESPRTPKDIDLFTDHPELWDTGTDAFWHPKFKEYWDGEDRYATLDELYTIKVSHSYWELKNGTWDKHMYDIVQLKNAGAALDLELHKTLYGVWEETHGRKKVDLNMTKDAFFTDAVKRVYDHDSLHASVAYGDKPIYENMFVDGQEITMDMNKIKASPFEIQVKLFREEVYATALERWVVPSGYTVSSRLAYARALKKTITSLTKGWSSTFIVDHYEIFRVPDVNYVALHLSRKERLILL